MTDTDDTRDAVEILSLRSRLHEIGNMLHLATVRIEVTATRLEAAVAQIERMALQLNRIEYDVHELQKSKANLDGRIVVIGGIMSAIVGVVAWAVARWMP